MTLRSWCGPCCVNARDLSSPILEFLLLSTRMNFVDNLFFSCYILCQVMLHSQMSMLFHITIFIMQLDKKREWEMMCRVKPDVVKDREKERNLQRIATR